MVRNDGNAADESQQPHKCGALCLGPLTFDTQTVGRMIRLSHGGRRAERPGTTFKNGLMFSSRAVKVQERVRLRVEKELNSWHGALRLGFTNVPPSDRALPLPSMAIPDLSVQPGHWVSALHDSLFRAGSVLEFWVSSRGTAHVKGDFGERKLLAGVDLSKPLWAMIDLYGQTCCISLLGSERKKMFSTYKSCPAPEPLPPYCSDSVAGSIPDVSNLIGNLCISGSDDEADFTNDPCVVCYGREARITLPCGHRCLCSHCSPKILQQFGTCPLCRHVIRA